MAITTSALTVFAADAADNARQTVSNLSATSQNALGTNASETINAQIFPVEVAFVILGALMLTGFLLLARESMMERRHR